MPDRVAEILAGYPSFGAMAPEWDDPSAGLSRMNIPSQYGKVASALIGVPAPPRVNPDLIPMPRNPARAPQALEDAAWGMTVQPAMDIGMGIGSMVEGQGWNNPEATAGVAAAMGLLTPMKAGALKPRTGIRAYHGSPHDFDRFDMSRIGTGEGAQAYGHGLYFAENPEVAANYKMPHNHVVAGNVYDVFPTQDAAMAAAGKGGGAIPYQGGWVAEPLTGGIIKKNPGKMYEVNINAKPEQFLDWDRPLGQQPKPVQDLAGQSPIARYANPKMPGYDFYSLVGQEMKSPGFVPNGNVPPSQNYGVNATNVLRDAGVPGIRYLDQGSRNMGLNFEVLRTPNGFDLLQGRPGGGDKVIGSYASRAEADAAREAQLARQPPETSNYVLFDDKLIDIMKKWGLFGATAGAGTSAISNKSDAKPFDSLSP